jgi:hypothetical protein
MMDRAGGVAPYVGTGCIRYPDRAFRVRLHVQSPVLFAVNLGKMHELVTW